MVIGFVIALISVLFVVFFLTNTVLVVKAHDRKIKELARNSIEDISNSSIKEYARLQEEINYEKGEKARWCQIARNTSSELQALKTDSKYLTPEKFKEKEINFNNFVYNLKFVADRYTKNSREHELFDIIISRINKENGNTIGTKVK